VSEDGMSEQEQVDWDRVEEFTLALMYLTTFPHAGLTRSWKGYAWEVVDRLHAKGLISDPGTKAKSVELSDDAARRSRELFLKHFAAVSSPAAPPGEAATR
jgi:Domain of unknown function (DUF6429)